MRKLSLTGPYEMIAMDDTFYDPRVVNTRPLRLIAGWPGVEGWMIYDMIETRAED